MSSYYASSDLPVPFFSRIVNAEVRDIAIDTIKMIIPLIFMNMAQFTIEVVSVAFCGHLGTNELDAVSLACTIISMFVFAFMEGFSTACDALMSQIFGTSNKKMIGVVLQRNLLILFFISIVLVSILLHAERILISIGQDAIISKMTSDYLLCMIPAVFSFAVDISLQKYLSTQKIFVPILIANVMCNIANAFLHWLFLFHYDFGIMGSALSQTISYIGVTLYLILHVVISGIYKVTWDGWTMEAFQEWDIFLKLAFGGLLMILIEWGSFQFAVILSGTIGPISLAAQSIAVQICNCLYAIPFSVAIATSIKVGHNLGSATPQTAKLVIKVGYGIGEVLAVISLIILVSTKDYTPYIFSNDADICQLVSKILIFVSCYMVFDTIVSISCLILRGVGKPWTGAIIIGCCHGCVLFIGIPIMLWKQNVLYFWLVLAFGIIIAAIVILICVCRLNWDQLVIDALERAKILPQDTLIEEQQSHFLHSEKTNEYKPSITRTLSRVDPCLYNSEQITISPVASSNHLTKNQLILRRGFLIILIFFIFLSSLFVKLYDPVNHNDDIANFTTVQPLFSTAKIA